MTAPTITRTPGTMTMIVWSGDAPEPTPQAVVDAICDEALLLGAPLATIRLAIGRPGLALMRFGAVCTAVAQSGKALGTTASIAQLNTMNGAAGARVAVELVAAEEFPPEVPEPVATVDEDLGHDFPATDRDEHTGARP